MGGCVTAPNPLSQQLADAAKRMGENFEQLECGHDGWVYVIAGNGLVKIGSVKPSLAPLGSLLARLRSIQAMSPTPLALLRLYTGGPAYERELHQRFADKRAHGEWFDEDVIAELDFTGCPACGLVVVDGDLATMMRADLQRLRGGQP